MIATRDIHFSRADVLKENLQRKHFKSVTGLTNFVLISICFEIVCVYLMSK